MFACMDLQIDPWPGGISYRQPANYIYSNSTLYLRPTFTDTTPTRATGSDHVGQIYP